MTKRCRINSNAAGFTMVELAVSLTVIALIAGLIVFPINIQIEARNRATANADLKDITQAMIAYAVANGRLPCPDCRDGTGGCAGVPAPQRMDGIQDLNGTVCRTFDGIIPFAELRAPSRDPWGTAYQYHVTSKFADIGAAGGNCPLHPPGRASFNLCVSEVGDIDVSSDVAVLAGDVARDQPAVILSYGKNRNVDELAVGGTLSGQEQENLPVPAGAPGYDQFILRPVSEDDLQEFDDQVDWVPLNVLRSRMVSGGQLP